MPTDSLLPQYHGHLPTSANPNGLPTSVYEPLQSARHIRLLRVPAASLTSAGQASSSQPRSSDQELYELVHVSLATYWNAYQAVSYFWGDPIQDHSLKINGQHYLPITKSLAVALPQLTQICSTGFLWIDQICIDQSNNQERGQQVSIMGEIFSNATGVLIWTGGELDGLSEMKTQLSRPDDFERSHIETLIKLHCRPWFSRGWTIQEAALAKTAILIAGACLLPLEDIERAWHKKNISFSRDQLDRCRIGKASFDIIIALRKGVLARFHDSGFDGLLNSLGDTQTSDARDHVYAFLGLKHNPRMVIRPNYNASIGEAFTNATRAIIEGTGTLDCFRFLPPSRRSESFILPSWVPDWSRRNREPRLLQDSAIESSHVPPFQAAKGFCHNIELPPSSRADILHVSGRIIDFVELRLPNLCRLVYRTIYPQQEVPVTARPRFFSMTNKEVTIIDDRALIDPTQNLRKRLMSVLVAGHFDAEGMLTKYDNGGENDLKFDKDQFLNLQLRRMWSHQMWITRSRRLALIPPISCEKGDMLAIIHGLNAPLLLGNRGGSTYAVRGQCYLEDAMFGEAVTWEEDKADMLLLV